MKRNVFLLAVLIVHVGVDEEIKKQFDDTERDDEAEAREGARVRRTAAEARLLAEVAFSSAAQETCNERCVMRSFQTLVPATGCIYRKAKFHHCLFVNGGDSVLLLILSWSESELVLFS